MELHGEGRVLEKLLGMSQMLKLIEMIDISSPFKNLLKIQTYNVTNKKSYSLFFFKKRKKRALGFLFFSAHPSSPIYTVPYICYSPAP